MAWKPEWVAVGISVLALLGSGAGVFYQQQQLAVAQQEWADARGKVEIKAQLSTYNKGTWNSKPAKSNIAESELLAPVELFAIVDITNSGATATAIKEVGFWKSQDQKVSVSGVLCNPTQRGGGLISCEFPMRLPEFGKATFYIPLSQYLKTDLQCNEYLRDNGIRNFVQRIDGDTASDATDATVAAASYCPEFSPPKP